MDELEKKQSGIEKKDQELQQLKKFYSPELKKKNYYDDDFYMHPTSMMKQMFVHETERYDRNIFNYRDELAFEMITPDKINLRTISPDEYTALSERMKNDKATPLKAFLNNIVFFLAAMVFVYFMISGSKEAFKYNFTFFLVALLVFVICFIRTLNKSDMIPVNSEVAIGNAICFDQEGHFIGETYIQTYYVDVAFYDEKKFVRRIKCDEKQFRKLHLDSKVVIYNSKAYALE